ncbi:MAG: NosD domain-containing protein [Promethearchaeota archaeon]|jgi:parallel beta-helix repeat protein
MNIKSAGHRDPVGFPILIDDSDPNLNWNKTAVENSWCSGTGSWFDPYVIENISVNSKDLGNCIEVRNSNAYFAIIDCELYNSMTTLSYFGISLINTNNSIIKHNLIFFNREGIYLSECNNNTIMNNTIKDYDRGVSLTNSHNNTVSDNILKTSYLGLFILKISYRGIDISFSNDNTISGNIVKDNHYGIYVHGNYNNISGNKVINSIYGISLEGNSNHLSKNLMKDCGLYLVGSLEDLVTNNIDTTNNASGKPIYFYTNKLGSQMLDFSNAGQVILVNCSNFTLSNLSISHSTSGISLFYCTNITVSKCDTSFNKRWGVYLYSSDENTVIGSIANNNNYKSGIGFLIQNSGIVLIESNANTIHNNNASYNREKGIHLSESYNNLISKNNMDENPQGIYLYESADNTITENSVYKSRGFYGDDSGIFLSTSSNNNISSNILNHNLWGITLVFNCHYNIISGNSIINNNLGIYVDRSDDNIISGNNLSYNQVGISLKECSETITYSNCFNNGFNAYDTGSNNQWDKERRGNYWSDYTGTDLDMDGIGNTPYLIDGSAGSKDNFPLMEWSGLIVERKKKFNGTYIKGYNLFFILGLLSVAVILVSKKLKKS